MSMKSTVPPLVAIIAATALWGSSANSQSIALNTFVGSTGWPFDTCMRRMEEILRGEGFVNVDRQSQVVAGVRGAYLAHMAWGA